MSDDATANNNIKNEPEESHPYTGINSNTGDSHGNKPTIRRILASNSSLLLSPAPDTPYFEPFPAHAGAAANNPAVRQQILQYAHLLETLLAAIQEQREQKAGEVVDLGPCELCCCLLNCCWVFDLCGVQEAQNEYYRIQSFKGAIRSFYLGQINVAWAQPQGIQLRMGSRPTGEHGEYSVDYDSPHSEDVYYLTAVENFDPRLYTQEQIKQALLQVQSQYAQGIAGGGEDDGHACQDYANKFLQEYDRAALPQLPQQLGACAPAPPLPLQYNQTARTGPPGQTSFYEHK